MQWLNSTDKTVIRPKNPNLAVRETDSCFFPGLQQMATITLRVLDGADRGKVFEELQLPITIGREEGNAIQLNDERISRVHLRIQSDHEDIVLTDLESTNGCRVNNEEVQLRILRHGDLITVGRSTLIFGNRQQINQRLKLLDKRGSHSPKSQAQSDSKSNEFSAKPSTPANQGGDLPLPDDWKDDPNYQLALLEKAPPSLPDRLSPGQAAKLSEMIEFLHINLRLVIQQTDIDHRRQAAEMDLEQWQRLIDLQSRLAEYLRAISSRSE